MQTKVKKLPFLLTASVTVGMLASLPLGGVQAFAQGNQQKGTASTALTPASNLSRKVSAPLAARSAVDSRQESINAAITAQLAAKKIDYSKLTKEQQQNVYVDVVVQMSAAPASTNGSLISQYSSTAQIQEETRKVIAAQDSIKKAVQKITGQTASESYGYVVNGFATKAKVRDLEAIKKVAGVKSVTVNTVYYPSEANANSMANVQSVWSAYKYKGEGTVVSVIDTGIDPNHKDMRLSSEKNVKLTKSSVAKFIKKAKHGKYFTAKVPYGFNYADNNTIITDDSPDDQHGMHVAGIIGANGTGSNPATSVVGVAPEAQLLAMKVFTNSDTSSTTGTTTIVAAVEDSAKIGADVLNMSLGSTSGNQTLDDPEQAAVKNANDSGTAAVISAGNSGTTGSKTEGVNKDYYGLDDLETVGSPGTSRGATTVASAENSKVTTQTVTISDGTAFTLGPEAIQLSSNDYTQAFNKKKFYVVKDANGNLSTGNASDYTTDVKGKIAIVKRGSLTFTDKQQYAQAAGAAGLIIVNNQNTTVPLTSILLNAGFPTFGLSGVTGQKLVDWVTAHPDDALTVTIAQTLLDNAVYAADPMSTFTSYGPVSDLSFKPDITAPGGNIWSTQNNNGYTNMSGTSMASPFVAGSQALLKQAMTNKNNKFYSYYTKLKGSKLTDFIKTVEMNTAQPINDSKHSNAIVSPRRQGAGMVDVKAAIDALENNPSTVVSANGYPAVELKYFTSTSKTFTLTFTNPTKKTLTYTMDSNEDTNAVYTSATEPSTGILYDVKIDGASITTKQKISVKAGKTSKVTFSLNLPTTFDQQKFVEGYLNFKDNDGSRLNIPYMGFFGDWNRESIVDPVNGIAFSPDEGNTGTIPLLVSKAAGKIYYGGLTYDSEGNLVVDPSTVAFSTDPNALYNKIGMQYYLLRNIKDVKVDILTSEGKKVTTLYTSTDEVKSYYYSNGGRYIYFKPPTWDGTYYDQSTGKTVTAADGKYIYRLSATPQGGDKVQTYDLNFTLDSQAPEVRSIDLASKTVNGKTSYYVTAEVKDNLSGLNSDKAAATAVNHVVNNDSTFTETGTTEDGYTTIEVPLTPAQAATVADGSNVLELYLTDNAGNPADEVATAQKPDSVSYSLVMGKGGLPAKISSVTAGYTGGTNGGTYTFTGTYPVRLYGTYTDSAGVIHNLTVSYDAEDNFFASRLPLEAKDYTSTVSLYTNAAHTKLVKSYTVQVRLAAPQVTATVDDGSGQTSESTVTVTGKVSDDTVAVAVASSASSRAVTASIAADHTYTAQVPVTYGSNTITVTAADADGNRTTVNKTVTSSYDTNVLSNAVTFYNGITFGQNEITANSRYYDAKAGTVTVTGKVKHSTTTLTVDGKNVNINDDLTFSVTLKVGKQGMKTFSVIIGDSSQNKTIQDTLVFVLDSVPPTLTLKNPTNRTVYTTNPSYRIRGTATDNLNYLSLAINGSQVKSQYADIDYNSTKKGKMTIDETVTLVPGKNVLTVTVSDAGGNKTSKTITVEYSPKTTLAKPNVNAQSADKTKAVTLKAAPAAQGQTVLYSIDGGQTYGPVPAEGLTVTANRTVQFKSSDAYGNESAPLAYTVDTIVTNGTAANPEQKSALASSLATAQKLLASGKYSDSSRATVKVVLAAAQQILNQADPQAAALAETEVKLQTAVNQLQNKISQDDQDDVINQISSAKDVLGTDATTAYASTGRTFQSELNGLASLVASGTTTAQQAQARLNAITTAAANQAAARVKAASNQAQAQATQTKNPGKAAAQSGRALADRQTARKAEETAKKAAAAQAAANTATDPAEKLAAVQKLKYLSTQAAATAAATTARAQAAQTLSERNSKAASANADSILTQAVKNAQAAAAKSPADAKAKSATQKGDQKQAGQAADGSSAAAGQAAQTAAANQAGSASASTASPAGQGVYALVSIMAAVAAVSAAIVLSRRKGTR